METEQIADRIVMIMEHMGVNVATFARKIGIGDQTVRSVCVQRRNKPGYDFIAAILRTLPWVDSRWLLTGEGEMMGDQKVIAQVRPELNGECMEILVKYLKEKDERIEQLVEEMTRWKTLYQAEK